MADENSFSQYALFGIPIPNPQMTAPANLDQSVPTLVNAKDILEATLQTLNTLENNVYSKTDADARFYSKTAGEGLEVAVANRVTTTKHNQDIQEITDSLGNFIKKTDTINGLRIQMDNVGYKTERVDDIVTLYGVSYIKFKPSLLGMFNGEVLRTISIKAIDTLNSITLKRGDDIIATSESAEIVDQETVFKFQDSTEIHFYDNEELTIDLGRTVDLLGLEGNSPRGISCDGHDQYSTLLENCEPIIELNWMTPATATVVMSMIKRLAPNFREKLSDIVGIPIFGTNEYSVEDLRERLDLIIRVLKNLGEEYRDQLNELTEIGEGEYETDDLRKRLDTVLLFLQGLADG